ncbi:MAG TPA: ParB/RepB/Spo0J family partition protein [Dongiaceae bacterium]|nr:ParB/RepB/Spo0J family partition protein [Dongiaceae bacterium]
MADKKSRLAGALSDSFIEESKSVSSEAQRARDRFRLADKLENAGGIVMETEPRDAEPPSATAPGGEGGDTLIVDISTVLENPLNARRIYDEEVIKERAASILANGQLTAAPVIRNPDKPGTYILLDGHYRKRALQYLNRPSIKIEVKEIKDRLDLYRYSYLLNDQRSQQTALDDSLAWNDLLEKGEADFEKIVQVTGASKAKVSKTISIGKLSAPIIEKASLTPAQFGLEMLYELYLYEQKHGNAKAVVLLDKIIDDELSTRDVALIRKSEEAVRTRKTKEISRQYKIRSGDAEIGYIKDWDSGRLVFEVTQSDASIKEAILADLKALAEKYGGLSH